MLHRPRLTRVFTNCSSEDFTALYFELRANQDMDSSLSYLDAHLNFFNSNCSNILNVVAPLKVKKLNLNSKPWLDDTTCSLRQICRSAERKWNKDRLQVSYEILKDSLSAFQ